VTRARAAIYLEPIRTSSSIPSGAVDLGRFDRTEQQALKGELTQLILILDLGHGNSQCHPRYTLQPVDIKSHKEGIMKAPWQALFDSF